MKEIGSDFFHFYSGNDKLDIPEKLLFCFSGRTAIDLIIKDAKIKKICLPSYCCSSMIDPFLKNGVKLSFYQVNYERELVVELNIPDDCDAVLWCSYFGYGINYPKELYDFKMNNGIVIEDITHSLFLNQHFEKADYVFASIRKWDAFLSGGFVWKKKGTFNVSLSKPENEFAQMRMEAMGLKNQYIKDGDQNKKNEYLELFKESNIYFQENYENVSMDDYSLNLIGKWNTRKIIETRINNAKILHEGIEKIEKIHTMFEKKNIVCPIFVPVIFESKELRDSISKKLIENRIYCPTHWPKPKYQNRSNVYDRELSLVCDQRYGQEDMERILTVLREI